jgi:hypothetical protein
VGANTEENLHVGTGIDKIYLSGSRVLSTFVKRWHADTSTFHMPYGEMTVMLDPRALSSSSPYSGTIVGPYRDLDQSCWSGHDDRASWVD